MTLAAGTRLGPYEITSFIGAGGMGEVYKARDTRLHRDVAIKVLHADLADPARRRRFLSEARAAAAINHPNVATIYWVDEAGPGPFIAMELIEGKTLRAMLEERKIPLAAALRLAIEIGEGICEAHKANVVHRDLKPENIIVTRDERAKILDFGVAKVIQEGEKESSSGSIATETRSVTEREGIVGTPAYMSPEQIRGGDVDARSDIFSFGIILFEMMTGQLPFRGDTRIDLLAAIIDDLAVAPSRLNARVPAELDRIIAKCLEKDRRTRFQHTDDLVVDLRRLRDTMVGTDRAVSRAAGTSEATAVSERKKIVVLPFENLGPPEEEYFASGMTEEIISRLAGITGLGVISRTTAMQYDKAGKSIRQIGDELGVDFVLEGTVRWARAASANRVRITPQLIRVSDDTHVWASRYDRIIDDVFQVQSDIAEHVSAQLGVKLLDAERQELQSTPTRNVEAYQAYLRGLFYERPRGFLEERDRLAVQMFEQAVELDPTFALAHAELAIAHAALYHYGFDHSEGRQAMAARAVDQAVRIKPDSPRVRLAMGYYYYWCRRDYERALEELTIAEKGMPGNSEVLAAMGFVRRRQGMYEAALEHFEKAAELNPMDTHFAIQLADTLFIVGRYPEAEAHYDLSIRFLPDQIAAYVAKADLRWTWLGDIVGARQALEAMPETARSSSFGFIHWFWQEIFEGKYDAALERVGRISGDVVNPATKNLLSAQACSLLGDGRRAHEAYAIARTAIETEIRSQPANYWLRASIGIVYAGLGLKEDAIREGKTAAELCPMSADPIDGRAFVKNLALILTTLGEYEAAAEQIRRLLAQAGDSHVEYLPLVPSAFSLPLLRLDPRWKPLWNFPPFVEMIAGGSRTPTSVA